MKALFLALIVAPLAFAAPAQAAVHGVLAAPVAATKVLAVASRYIGDGNITGRPGRWCKWFVNFVLARAGYYVQGSGMARDARLLGAPTSPHPGAIAYNDGHTAFVAAVDGDRVLLLGGNQVHRRVSYMRAALHSFRFVQPVPL